MKKVYSILFVACIAMLFASCHKDGVYNPSKKISKIYSVYSGSRSLDQVWTWNKNNTLEKIDYYDGSIYKTHNFTYEKKRLVRMNDYANNNYVEYQYDNKGLKQANCFYGGTLSISYTFTHKNGKIIQITETDYYYKGVPDNYDMNPLQFVIPDEISTVAFEVSKKHKKDGKSSDTYVYDLTWTKNNVTKMVYYAYGYDYSYTYEAQYDKKKNPFYGAYLNFYFEDNLEELSKNNITHIERTATEGGETYRYAYNYEYTYNGQWPTSQRFIDEDGSNYLREFEYTK